MSQLTRRVMFTPAYDTSRNGCHGLEMEFVLTGAEGAVVFTVHTAMYLKRTYDRWGPNSSPSQPYGRSITVHAVSMIEAKDKYDTCSLLKEPCEFLLLPSGCYSKELTGSCFAGELLEKFLTEGEAPVWKELEEQYEAVFPNKQLQL